MADKVEVTNFPKGDSATRVAFDLMLRVMHVEETKGRKAILDLYAECLYAANGYRDWQKS